MSVSRQAVRGALQLTAASYATQIVSFLASLILLRLLDTSHYGAFGLAIALANTFARVKTWGFSSLVVAEHQLDDSQISTYFWLSTLLSIGTAVIVLVAAPLLGLIYAPEQIFLTLVVAATAIMDHDGLASAPETLIRRELRFGVLSGAIFASTTIGLLATALIAWSGPKSWALFIGFAAQNAAYLSVTWSYAPRRPRFLFSVPYAKSLLKRGSMLLWGGLGTFLAFGYDDLAVGTLTGATVLGYYRKAYDWSLIPTSIMSGVLGVTQATYARVARDRALLSESVTLVLNVMTLVGIPASIGLAFTAPQFVTLFFSERWLPAVPMLQILTFYSLLRPLSDSIGGLAAPLGRIAVMRTYGIVTSVTMLVVCSALTLAWGAYGAALSAGITVLVGLIVLYVGLLHNTVDVDYAQAFILPISGTALALVVSVVAVNIYLPPFVLAALFYKIGVFSAIYLSVLMLVDRKRLFDFAELIITAVWGHQRG